MGVPFGFDAPLEELELQWDLPDSVLGGYLRGKPRWTPQNRPFVDVSKPAISGR